MDIEKEYVRILSIGCRFEHPQVREIAFESDDTVLDADIILFDAAPFVENIKQEALDRSYKDLSEDRYMEICSLVKRRSSEFLEFLDEGRVLIVFARSTPTVPYRVGYTSETAPLDVHEYFHWGKDAFKPAAGVNIGTLLTSPYKEFFEATIRFLHYRAIIRENLGDRIASVHRTWLGQKEKMVASHERLRGGHCVYLPPPDEANDAEDQYAFIDAIIDFALALPSDPEPKGLPDWHGEFLIPGEETLADNLQTLLNDRRKLDEKIESQRAKYRNILNLKWLIAGRNSVLEEVVMRVFMELGLEVEKGPRGGTDLIVKYGNNVAVVEIKGRDRKSAARADGRQLANWVEEYYDKHRHEPKGILIFNAFAAKPLTERTKATYPKDTIKYCVRQNFCLLTGLQLLCLYLDCRNKKAKKKKALDVLFTHKGLYPEYQGEAWETFVASTKQSTVKS